MSKYVVCSCWVLDGEDVSRVVSEGSLKGLLQDLGVPAQYVAQCLLDGKRWAEHLSLVMDFLLGCGSRLIVSHANS